jgi:hypothetical protein
MGMEQFLLAREQVDDGYSDMFPFMDWAKAQGGLVDARLGVCIALVHDVLEGRQQVDMYPGVPVPDYWAMAHACESLRDTAREAGFSGAARYCEQERQFAVLMVEQLIGVVAESLASLA